MSDFESYLSARSDSYFKRTREIVKRYGDKEVTYAIFMRRPVIFCPKLAFDWIETAARESETSFTIEARFEEGDQVGAGEVLLYVSGQMSHLVDLETTYLQRLGAACVQRTTPTRCAHIFRKHHFLLWTRGIVRGMEWLI